MTKMKEDVERPSIEIGVRLRRLREEHELTQGQLAKYLGVGRSTVTRWEGGTAYPKNQLERLSRLYGVTMDYIYPGSRRSRLIKEIGYPFWAGWRRVYPSKQSRKSKTGRKYLIHGATRGSISPCG